MTGERTGSGPRERLPDHPTGRRTTVSDGFSLAETCAPVAWAEGRWPQWSWGDGWFRWAGWDGDQAVWRGARLIEPGVLTIEGTAAAAGDGKWAGAVLGIDRVCAPFGDPVIETLRLRFPGMRPFAAGSLFDGLVTSIVGQSITVKAAAVVLRRVAGLFATQVGPVGVALLPLPRPDHLAGADRAALRATGLTWRRADALIAAGRSFADDPAEWSAAGLTSAEVVTRLRTLPLVGPWTANAAVLWGTGADDVHVSGDVALLRAARLEYGEPGWTTRDVDRIAEGWRPARGMAARLLWCALLGTPAGAITGGT